MKKKLDIYIGAPSRESSTKTRVNPSFVNKIKSGSTLAGARSSFGGSGSHVEHNNALHSLTKTQNQTKATRRRDPIVNRVCDTLLLLSMFFTDIQTNSATMGVIQHLAHCFVALIKYNTYLNKQCNSVSEWMDILDFLDYLIDVLSIQN